MAKKTKTYRLDPSGAMYYRELRKLLKSYRSDVERELFPAIKRYAPETPIVQDSWVDSIESILEKLREKWAKEVGRFRSIATDFVKLAYSTSEKKVKIGIDVYGQSERMQDYLKAAVSQNVTLIKSISQDYHQQVENIVLGNLRQGWRSSKIIDELVKQYGVRERHARFIARDQSSKVKGELVRVRQLDAGYEYFKWETSHDESVRATHRELAEQDVGYGKGVYRWDDLPLVDGEPLYPGSDYQCRCHAKPIRNLSTSQAQV